MSIETEQSATKQIADKIHQWLDIRYKTAKAGAANEEQLKAIEQMRHLHLDDYWYTVANEIAKEFVE